MLLFQSVIYNILYPSQKRVLSCKTLHLMLLCSQKTYSIFKANQLVYLRKDIKQYFKYRSPEIYGEKFHLK